MNLKERLRHINPTAIAYKALMILKSHIAQKFLGTWDRGTILAESFFSPDTEVMSSRNYAEVPLDVNHNRIITLKDSILPGYLVIFPHQQNFNFWPWLRQIKE